MHDTSIDSFKYKLDEARQYLKIKFYDKYKLDEARQYLKIKFYELGICVS